MTSAHDESGDDTTSSLGDSSYDFIHDRSDVTTDDEDQDAMTESTTSSDGHAFEQVHAPSQGSEQGGYVDRPSRGQMVTHPQNQQGSSDVEQVSSSHGLGQTITHLDPHPEHQPIEFDEPSITSLNSSRFTEVSHTLNIIEKQNPLHESYSNLLDRLQGHLAVTVRQTMTSHSLAPQNGQYKIMYVGDVMMKELIVQKIGTALAAGFKASKTDLETPRSSKFNIVPISAFGEESSPEVVLIDSSGLELTVEDCNSTELAREESENDSLRLHLSGGTVVHSSWDGAKFVISNDWKLPDVAVFCVPDNDNLSLRKTRQFARSFMSRHKVMSIVISQSPMWELPPSEPTTLDYLTPHICLESRKSSLVHYQIIRRYPIDLATFLDIDAGQLNRNLACLAVASRSPKSQQGYQNSNTRAKKLPSSSDWSVRGIIESIVADVQKDGLWGLNRYEYIAGLAVVLISLLGILVGALGLSELLGASRVSTSRVFPTHTGVLSIPSVLSTKTTASSTVSSPLPSVFAPTASSPLSTSAHVPSPRSLPTNTDIASFLLDAYTLAPNKSEQFKVHVLGDCHIVLRPPHWFNKMRKSPKLLFKILRGDTELEHQTTTLFDGVYALQVPREDAYGILNVEIWTESKPMVNESFEVDFGSSWLKVAGWKKATHVLSDSLRGGLHSVQTSLSTAYDHTKTGLSSFVQQQKKKLAFQNSEDNTILKARLEAAAKTKEHIVAQTRDLQHTFSRGLHTTRRVASRQITRKLEEAADVLVLYARSKTSVVLYQARILTRTVSGANVKAIVTGAGDFRRKHLRETQKRALKAWWSLRGAPKQKKLKVKARSRPPLGCEL